MNIADAPARIAAEALCFLFDGVFWPVEVPASQRWKIMKN
jgi:hypothetical protein